MFLTSTSAIHGRQRLVCLAKNLLHHDPQNRVQKTTRNMAAIKGPPLYAQNSGTHRDKKHVLTVMLSRSASQISGETLSRPRQNSPIADRICGSKSDPILGSNSGTQNGVQAKTYKKIGKCDPILDPILGPRFGPKNWVRFGPKNAVSHRTMWLLPADVLHADLRRTSMSMNVNTCFLSLRVPLVCANSRGPFMAAMFSPLFWILFWGP